MRVGGFDRWALRALITSAVVLAAAAGPAIASPASWQGPVRPMSPNPSSTHNQLNAVSASSATDAWAVGDYVNDTTHATDTLILHWDGASWTQISSPNPSPIDNELESVRAISPTNAWAVGYYEVDTPIVYETLILHWNGTAWSKVASPNPSAKDNYLGGVVISSTSAKSGWAVGDFHNGKTGAYDTLTLRWNGSTWSHVASPSPSSVENYLVGVRAPSPTDAWAVGYTHNGAHYMTLVEHWNGTSWSRVASPDPSSTDNELYATSGISPSRAWAVGYAYTTRYVTLVLHWNGTSWSRFTSPDPGPAENFLYAVRAESSTDAWAVGAYVSGAIQLPLVLHWNGTAWSQVAAPMAGSSGNELRGVTATSATDAWAVGWYEDSMSHELTLILHWDGTAWSQV